AQARVFEEAAAPADAGNLERLARPDLHAVRRQRQGSPRRDVGQDLFAAGGPGRPYDPGLQRIPPPRDALSPGPRRVVLPALLLGEVNGRHSIGCEAIGQRARYVADQERVQRHVELLGQPIPQRENLERQVVELAAIVLDDSQDHDGTTPSFWRTSTSFG